MNLNNSGSQKRKWTERCGIVLKMKFEFRGPINSLWFLCSNSHSVLWCHPLLIGCWNL